MFKKRLIELIQEIPKAEKNYLELKYKKEKRNAELYLQESNNFKTEELRKSAVRVMMENEGIIEPLIWAGYEYHKLLNEKEILLKLQNEN